MKLTHHLERAVGAFLNEWPDVPGDDMTDDHDPRPGEHEAEKSSEPDDARLLPMPTQVATTKIDTNPWRRPIRSERQARARRDRLTRRILQEAQTDRPHH